MLAVLTEEQEMLKATATQLAASVNLLVPADLETVDRAKAWTALSEAGFLSLRIREGGQPLASGVEVMLVCEALARALAPLPYVATVVASDVMARSGVEPRWLDELAAGYVRYGLLLSPDLSSLAVAGSGTPAVAVDVDQADYVLALSGTQGSRRVVRIPAGSGFDAAQSADLTRPMWRARSLDRLDAEDSGVRLSEDEMRGWLALALVAVNADTIGVMTSGLQKAVDYAKERVQYGVKIGSFQAIQHLCADALTDIEASASLNRYAAWSVDASPPQDALLAARVAKAYTASVARKVTETVMQVFGGIGQTWEHIAHFHTRRALVDRALFGDESVHLLEIADARMGVSPVAGGRGVLHPPGR